MFIVNLKWVYVILTSLELCTPIRIFISLEQKIFHYENINNDFSLGNNAVTAILKSIRFNYIVFRNVFVKENQLNSIKNNTRTFSFQPKSIL